MSGADAVAAPAALGIVGAGAMGRGIAEVAALAGWQVLLTDARPEAVPEALTQVRSELDRLVTAGRLAAPDAAAAAGRLDAVDDVAGLGGLAGAAVVVEAVVEDLTVKRDLFRALEAAVPATTVLATNTSALSITAIAAGLRHPERVCGLHFFNPVPRRRLVEVVSGELTAEATADRMAALVRGLGHTPVRVGDTPGFLVNHAGRAYATEALRLLDEGVAAPADIDRVLREVAGFPMGPFALMDLTGLDVSHPVTETVWRGYYADPRLRPSPTARRRMLAGRLGRKTGEGFYSYAAGGVSAPAEPPAPAYEGTPLWLRSADPGVAALAGRLRAAGVTVEDGPSPSARAVAVVSPWGADVTTACLAAGLAPQRTVGVDPFGGFAGRLTLAVSPATSAAAAHAAWAALAATGAPVTRIADSPGFLAQRVVACVVNLGCEVAGLGLAAPAEVDTAVTLALGYPHGPLAWGDLLGPRVVVQVLTGLGAATGDPRYRPSPWLTRRAALGLSLLTPATPPDFLP